MDQQSLALQLLVSGLNTMVTCVPISFSETVLTEMLHLASGRHLADVTPSQVSPILSHAVKVTDQDHFQLPVRSPPGSASFLCILMMILDAVCFYDWIISFVESLTLLLTFLIFGILIWVRVFRLDQEVDLVSMYLGLIYRKVY